MASSKPPVHPDVELTRRQIRALIHRYQPGVNPLLTADMWHALVKGAVFDILATRVSTMQSDVHDHNLPTRAVDAAVLVAEGMEFLERTWNGETS